MKRINLAARVLLDAVQRARYDDLRRQGTPNRQAAPVQGGETKRPRTSRSGRSTRVVVRRAHAGRDAFTGRLAGFAVLVTLLVAFATERARTDSLASHPKQKSAATVYAADYPPAPVRYALADALGPH